MQILFIIEILSMVGLITLRLICIISISIAGGGEDDMFVASQFFGVYVSIIFAGSIYIGIKMLRQMPLIGLVFLVGGIVFMLMTMQMVWNPTIINLTNSFPIYTVGAVFFVCISLYGLRKQKVELLQKRIKHDILDDL